MESHAIIECSGALICARNTKRFLLLQKNAGRNIGTWGLAGGTHLNGETAAQGLQREVEEELGFNPNFKKIIPVERFVSNDSLFNFRTYFCIVDIEFVPCLSHEHSGWGWFNIYSLPKPVHKGLELSIRNKIFQTKLQTLIEIIEDI